MGHAEYVRLVLKLFLGLIITLSVLVGFGGFLLGKYL